MTTTRVTLAQIRKEARRVFGVFALVHSPHKSVEVYPTTPGPRRVLAFSADSQLIARRFALETLAAMPSAQEGGV